MTGCLLGKGEMCKVDENDGENPNLVLYGRVGSHGRVRSVLAKPRPPLRVFQTPVYEWSPETQGLIFSSINYGIILTLIPSGYLAGIVGAKRVLGAGLLVSSLLTLFTPLAADLGVTLVVVIRIAQEGMAQVSRHFPHPRGKQTPEFWRVRSPRLSF